MSIFSALKGIATSAIGKVIRKGIKSAGKQIVKGSKSTFTKIVKGLKGAGRSIAQMAGGAKNVLENTKLLVRTLVRDKNIAKNLSDIRKLMGILYKGGKVRVAREQAVKLIASAKSKIKNVRLNNQLDNLRNIINNMRGNTIEARSLFSKVYNAIPSMKAIQASVKSAGSGVQNAVKEEVFDYLTGKIALGAIGAGITAGGTVATVKALEKN
jgi:hypothetical protein